MSTSPEAKQAAENLYSYRSSVGIDKDRYNWEEAESIIQQAIDTATAKLREELEESSDETWLEALKFLGLEPVIYDMGETREETISHICSLYGRQVEKLKEQLAHQQPSLPDVEKIAQEASLEIAANCIPVTANDADHVRRAEKIITKYLAQARAPFATANPRLVALAKFFASVIKSGEGWTATCEREYHAALTGTGEKPK